MLDFQPITLEKKEEYTRLLQNAQGGCEYAFANLYLWGRQRAVVVQGQLALFSQFSRRSVYPYPAGPGDKKAVLDAMIKDAAQRGIPCRITGLNQDIIAQMEAWYPGKFRFHCDRDSYDYVYDIHDLADLKGRKYQPKRNYVNRFKQNYPQCTLEKLTRENLPQVETMAKRWYDARRQQDPSGDYHMEQSALKKAFRDFTALDLEGMALLQEDEVIAFTMGSRLNADTFDIHFEKALAGYDGAYAVINQGFARYLREAYPQVQYLNREDDLGLESLRKAKLSYGPHHLVEKCWACLLEDGYDY